MVSVVAVWNGEEIEYHVTKSDPYSREKFSGPNAFLQAWAAAQGAINDRMIEDELCRHKDRISGDYRLTVNPLANPNSRYSFLYPDDSMHEPGFATIDEAVQHVVVLSDNSPSM